MEKVYDLSESNKSVEIKKVLLLEDDIEFSQMLRTFLEVHDFQVTCVGNGAEGLRKIMSMDFDIILCDMVMPSLPGDMFYLAVEKTKPDLCRRFVFMTGHRADPKWDAFIRRIKGIMLWKPFPLPDLLSTMQAVMQKASASAPRLAK